MKVLEIFASFEKRDWHWLEKFAKSPIYNKNMDLIRLTDWFRRRMNTRHILQSLSKKLHDYLWPDQPFDAAKIHHTGNYLHDLSKSYLAWDEWQSDESNRQYSLLQACRRRGLERTFHETLQQLREKSEKQPLRHPTHYRFRYQLTLEAYQYGMQTARSANELLQPLSDWHDVAFVAEKLRNGCILISRKRFLPADYDLGLLPAALEFVQRRPHLLQYPAVALYYYGYLALSEPERDEHYFSLKRLLPEAGRQFPFSELRDIYLLAINFCIPRINLRQELWVAEVFDLYKTGLDLGIFLENQHLSRFTYTNIALAGLRLGEFAWVYGFLHDYRDKLPESQKDGAFSFNLARFYCEKGDYDRAMPLLQRMDFDDIAHNLTAKAMLIRMYFEIREIDALDSLLNSLAAYLRRKRRQIGDQQHAAYGNLIRITRKLVSISPRDTKSKRLLLEEITALPLIAEKDWLTRMLK